MSEQTLIELNKELLQRVTLLTRELKIQEERNELFQEYVNLLIKKNDLQRETITIQMENKDRYIRQAKAKIYLLQQRIYRLQQRDDTTSNDSVDNQ